MSLPECHVGHDSSHMSPKVFKAFRDFIYQQCGISLSDQKVALVSSRISRRMRELKIDSQSRYLQLVKEQGPDGELIHLLDAISTNVTHFFREGHHFQFVAKKLSEWQPKGVSKLRFWSAGCSSGEEPYSLAMTILDHFHDMPCDVRILATDISTRILNHCIAGVYDHQKVESIPSHLRNRYLDKNGNQWKIKDPVRRLITYRRLNLSVVPFPMAGPFDIIFCRNVMIYFDNFIRKQLLSEFSRLLRPGGFLFVGHSENLTGFLSDFQSLGPSIYIKVPK